MKDLQSRPLSQNIIAYSMSLCAQGKSSQQIQLALNEKGIPDALSLVIARQSYNVYIELMLKNQSRVTAKESFALLSALCA